MSQRGSSKLFLMLLLMLTIGGYFVWIGLQTAEQMARKKSGSPGGQEQSGSQDDSEYRNSIGMEFVLIPGGEFMMGSATDGDEKPVHKVNITQPFYMGKFEVTQAQWKTIMGTSIAQQRDKINPEWEVNGAGNDYPMYYITWDDTQAFIQRLNDFEGGNLYRLPTESEWEYACRAGSEGAFAGNLNAMGWFGENASETVHPVGQKQPNAWGLYDMYGNLAEWCMDWHGKYPEGTSWDPTGPTEGTLKVVRGGSWFMGRDNCRSSARMSAWPYRGNSSVGFRVVRNVQ